MRMLESELCLHLINLGEELLTSSDWPLNSFILCLLRLFLSNLGLLLGEFDLFLRKTLLFCLFSEPLSLNCLLLLLNCCVILLFL